MPRRTLTKGSRASADGVGMKLRFPRRYVVMLLLGTASVGVVAAISTGHSQAAAAHTFASRAGAVFPLRVSSNRRYLVDQRNAPFFVVGDSPQAMIGNLSLAEARTFISDRKSAGFNALWVSLLCRKLLGCRDDGSTFDGIKPFSGDDLSAPNPSYFKRATQMVGLADRAGIAVFLDPIETASWLDVLRSNGVGRDYAYGRFLGETFRKFANVVWLNGNDFQSWSDPADDATALAVSRGIRSTDPASPQTVELNYFKSGSLDDPRWRKLIDVSSAYTYYPTYAKVLQQYNQAAYVPVLMLEAGYEFEQNVSWISSGRPEILRRQAYWSVLSGAAGQFYGNHYTWQFADGWQQHLDTTGSTQIGYLARFFSGRRWFDLVPDQAHKLVTAGFGTFSTVGNVGSSDYATTAATRDRKLVVSYLPAGGRLTLDMARFGHRMRGWWYDPTNGRYRAVSRALPPESNAVRVTAPKKNAAGDRDWILVLTPG